MKELIAIQSELNAPKGQYNKFGKYNYRSNEDILEALKPLMKKHKCYLIESDEIVLIGDRYYVKATATLYNETGDNQTSTAYAREPLTKKGMDEAQITGATSSYSRKYAKNALFAIDDTKDADSMDNRSHNQVTPKKTDKQLWAEFAKNFKDKNQPMEFLTWAGVPNDKVEIKKMVTKYLNGDMDLQNDILDYEGYLAKQANEGA